MRITEFQMNNYTGDIRQIVNQTSGFKTVIRYTNVYTMEKLEGRTSN